MQTLDVYRALWRHKYFIVALTGILVAAVWYLTSRQAEIYESTTLVRIQQQIDEQGDAFRALETGERLASTYAEIAETRALEARIRDLLSAAVPEGRWDVTISAEPVRQLELLRITASSNDPEVAALAANAAPRALRGFIRETGTLRDQIVTIDEARVASKPVSPNLALNLTLAIMLGVIFNGALALLLELLGDRLPEAADELEAALGRPVLATIPVVKLGERPGMRAGLEVVELPPGFEPGEAAAASSWRAEQTRAR